ncbi:MAG TPA: FkbM family methyltransferase [Chryseolinea sp.]|nr:FkbM family methyltransferase [Chryseolinea sp.]
MAFREGSVDEQVIKDTLEADIFFKGVPEYSPKEDDVVIDVGAHIGAFSVQAARRIFRSKIYAIEPSDESYELLLKNIAFNECENVFPFKIGLSDQTGQVRLFHDVENGNWGHSIVKEFSDEYEEIDCDTLGNFLATNGIQKCNFIKFNCEGAEFKVILSTPIEVMRKIETMLILYHSDLETKYSLNELISHLKAAEFLISKRFQFGDRGWIVAHRSITRHCYLKVKHWIKNTLKIN